MSDQEFKIVFEGTIVAGQDLENVKKNLAALFEIDKEDIEPLFSGSQVVLKNEKGA